MSDNFLPQDYEVPKSNSKYINKFDQGENKFRILSKAIIGTLVWRDNKPHRFKADEAVTIQPNDPVKNPPKHFWAMVVWSYSRKDIVILETTKLTIQEPIRALNAAGTWGSPMNYDIIVTKTGEGLDTKYAVMPSPKEEVTEEIKQALAENPVDLEKMFTGENPFLDKAVPVPQIPETTIDNDFDLVSGAKIYPTVGDADIKVEDLPF